MIPLETYSFHINFGSLLPPMSEQTFDEFCHLNDSLRIERAIVPPSTRLRVGDTTLELQDGTVAEKLGVSPVVIPGIVGESEVMKIVASQVERLDARSRKVRADAIDHLVQISMRDAIALHRIREA